MRITLEEGNFGWDYVLRAENGETILIQTDWDYPGTASSFGWKPCHCGFTDGTIDCEHRKTSDMIVEAADYLDNHIGDMEQLQERSCKGRQDND